MQLASQPPFAGRRPVMIGDDVGDEAALSVAEQLGGMALRVAGEHFGKDTADFDSVGDVRAWLEAVASKLGVDERVGSA
jgi:trehalose 6-phosphate phosphatase